MSPFHDSRVVLFIYNSGLLRSGLLPLPSPGLLRKYPTEEGRQGRARLELASGLWLLVGMARKNPAPFNSFSPRSLAQMPEFPALVLWGFYFARSSHYFLSPVPLPRGHKSNDASVSVGRQLKALENKEQKIGENSKVRPYFLDHHLCLWRTGSAGAQVGRQTGDSGLQRSDSSLLLNRKGPALPRPQGSSRPWGLWLTESPGVLV